MEPHVPHYRRSGVDAALASRTLYPKLLRDNGVKRSNDLHLTIIMNNLEGPQLYLHAGPGVTENVVKTL